MKFKWMISLALVLNTVSMGIAIWAQSAETELPADIPDVGWPRQVENGGQQVTVYQPQVDSWEGYTSIHFRSAISVIPGAGKEERFGILEVSADTEVDDETRTVVTHNHHREVRFPNVSEAEKSKLRKIFDQLLPPKESITVSLDRVLPYLEPDKQPTQHAVDVNLDPPKIYYSRQPAILVMFMGTPQLKPVSKDDNSLLFAANTNWDVFFDTAQSRYYLLNDGSWLTSDNPMTGSWIVATQLPTTLNQLPNDDNWIDVRSHIPGKPADSAPVVFVATSPTEMIVTEGEPAFQPIMGTKLLQVSNTDSTLFLHSGEGTFYYLVTGRWFRAKTLDGPWNVASNDLPADFLNIPDDSPAAFVKTAVPGTREAQDAVLLASIPRTLSVDVSNPPQVEVSYDGTPKFDAIQGTSVQYAVNTPNQVFLVSGSYYCCNQGVWFVAPAPTGPWLPATAVPPAIYTIPPSNPNYNVTYVTVQQSTPSTVVYSQTSGYSGEYVATNGVLMFGMGMLLGAAIADHHHNDYWYPRPCYYSYGSRATYHPGYGRYYVSPHTNYGPYGGAGRIAAYNPNTGTYSRGAYRYGPAGSAGVRQAYNPYTGGYAQQARVNTAYGSAGNFYAERGGKAASGGYRSGAQGTIGGVRTNQGTGAAAWNTKYGKGGVAKTRSGDVYAGRDGNVYKKDSSGQWQKYQNGNWNPLPPSPQPTGTRATATGNNTVNRQAVSRPAVAGKTPVNRETITRPTTPGKPSVGKETASRPTPALKTPASRDAVSRPAAPGKLPAKPESVSRPSVKRPAAGNQTAVTQGLQRDAQARTSGERRASQRTNFQRSGGIQRAERRR